MAADEQDDLTSYPNVPIIGIPMIGTFETQT